MRSRKTAGAGVLQALRTVTACRATEAAGHIFTMVDTNLSKSLLSSLNAGNMGLIVSASDQVDPSTYTNAGSFWRDYLCAELMSKFPDWDLGIDRSAVALSKFEASELALEGLSLKYPDFCLRAGTRSCTLSAVIHTARMNISRVLGDFCFDELMGSVCFGPGATTSLRRTESDLSFKFGASRLHATKGTLAYLPLIVKAFPSWTREVEVVEGSRLVTVPKNAKTDRAICIEPDLNMFLQKGIGNMIRRRLWRLGLLRPNSSLENQAAAGRGSATGRLATIDLSGASDSIHLGVVWDLFPPDWFSHIEHVRSPNVRLPSGVKNLTKVSSMGNGYTFELETLLFWSLAQAVSDLLGCGHVRPLVFGDDIIVASDVARPLIDVLSVLGFKTNDKKTFIDGPFRESCGKHFFNGSDVTPFYVRSAINTVERIYWLHNSLQRWAYLPYGRDSLVRETCELFQSWVDPRVRFAIPDGIGDCGFVSEWSSASASHLVRWQEGWSFTCTKRRTSYRTSESRGVLLKSLSLGEYAIESPLRPERVGSSSDLPVGEKLVINKRARVARWPDIGPWI